MRQTTCRIGAPRAVKLYEPYAYIRVREHASARTASPGTVGRWDPCMRICVPLRRLVPRVRIRTLSLAFRTQGFRARRQGRSEVRSGVAEGRPRARNGGPLRRTAHPRVCYV